MDVALNHVMRSSKALRRCAMGVANVGGESLVNPEMSLHSGQNVSTQPSQVEVGETGLLLFSKKKGRPVWQAKFPTPIFRNILLFCGNLSRFESLFPPLPISLSPSFSFTEMVTVF